MNILSKIIKRKKDEVSAQSKIISIDSLKDSQRLFSIRDFKKSLSSDKIDIIAEVKKKSPSEKDIMIEADVCEVGVSYELNGASSISVLTDQYFFDGHIDYINAVRSVVSVPVLRKDFIISEYQVWESFYIGADAILLIVDAIECSLLKDLYQLATHLGMYVLVEFHSIEGIKILKDFSPEIIGVNCRNLNTMQTDISWLSYVYEHFPSSSIKVAESGISTTLDLNFIAEVGYDAALIGTSFMKTGNPGTALAEILRRVPK